MHSNLFKKGSTLFILILFMISLFINPVAISAEANQEQLNDNWQLDEVEQGGRLVAMVLKEEDRITIQKELNKIGYRLEINGAKVIHASLEDEQEEYYLVNIPIYEDHTNRGIMSGIILPNQTVEIYTVTQDSEYLNVWYFQDGEIHKVKYTTHDECQDTETFTTGCKVCQCIEYGGGYLDQGCYSTALFGCKLIKDPIKYALCIGVAYVACYVPEYCAKEECYWSDFCPVSLEVEE